eukprot:scaffold12292_cov112-Isochrysis_galbana.AAC.4
MEKTADATDSYGLRPTAVARPWQSSARRLSACAHTVVIYILEKLTAALLLALARDGLWSAAPCPLSVCRPLPIAATCPLRPPRGHPSNIQEQFCSIVRATSPHRS